MTVTKNDPRTIFGWAMYDWANSAYITTFGAIVAAFFTGAIVPEDGYRGINGEALWSGVVSLGAAVLFLVMPVLGAVADYADAKKRFLRMFAWVGAVTAMALPFVPDGAVITFLFVVLITQIGFVAGNVFYDGFLPDITTDDTIDRVSSKGYAFGYIGGGIYVLLAFVVILLSERGVIGLEQSTAARIGIGGAGLWWLLFSFVALRRLPDDAPVEGRRTWLKYARIGFHRTISTGKKLLGFKHLLLFVLAFFFYNDAINTVIVVTGAYAEETLGLAATEIIITFLIVQFVAFGGAFFFGWLASKLGTKPTIIVTLLIWMGIAVAGYFLPQGEAIPLYALGSVVGLVLGGAQALSRSLYGSMVPEEASAEFFGFFTVFSKFSAIWGPLVFALVSQATGSGRPAILSVIAFFTIGLVILTRVDVAAGRASRQDWDLAEMSTL